MLDVVSIGASALGDALHDGAPLALIAAAAWFAWAWFVERAQ